MWRGRRVCKKRELLSLIGLLSHACKVVRAGRSFLRRLIDLSMIPKHIDHYVRLNAEATSDIEWWVRYVENWNGIQIMRMVKDTTPAALVTSDASGGWGCGAYSGTSWFMLKWAGSIVDSHITVKKNGSSRDCSNHLGSCLARENSAFLVRQHGSCSHRQPWILEKPRSNALSPMPGFHCWQV